MAPSLRVRSRGINWGSAEVRCSNGCPGVRAGISFPPDGEAAARQLLQEKWRELVGGLNDANTKTHDERTRIINRIIKLEAWND